MNIVHPAFHVIGNCCDRSVLQVRIYAVNSWSAGGTMGRLKEKHFQLLNLSIC